MEVIMITLIAFGLAMDSFAVSITSGITIKNLRVFDALKIAMFFGSFQAIMPICGWLAGLSIRHIISGVDHWIAFGLLSLIGCKMIYESIKIESDPKEINPLSLYVLLILSIATSIDALAIGITFAFLKYTILIPITIIGVITFLLSLFGVYVGNKSGRIFKNKFKIIGGLILIGIGIRILIEHLVFLS